MMRDMGLYPLRFGDTLSSNEWVELHFHNLLSSRFVALCLHSDRRDIIGTALLLWSECYRQDPAGTLPTDDIELAQLARYGTDIAAWQADKELALYGWGRCQVDGDDELIERLSHRTITDIATRSFRRKAGRARSRNAGYEAVIRSRVKKMLVKSGHSRMSEAGEVVSQIAKWLIEAGLHVTENNVREGAALVTGQPLLRGINGGKQ